MLQRGSVTLNTLPPCCYCLAAHFISRCMRRGVIYMQLRPDSTRRNGRKKGRVCAVFAAAIETLTLTALLATERHNLSDSAPGRIISMCRKHCCKTLPLLLPLQIYYKAKVRGSEIVMAWRRKKSKFSHFGTDFFPFLTHF
jgi:hypothetical protein